MAKKAKGAGGKQMRSEIIQARLSPKVRFAAELMARQGKRTLSSLIEILIEDASKNVSAIEYSEYSHEQKNVTIKAILDELWLYDEPKRLAVMGLKYPELLSPDEEKIWRKIYNSLYFWKCYKVCITDKYNNEAVFKWEPLLSISGIAEDNLNYCWALLKDENIPQDKLPPANFVGEELRVGPEQKVKTVKLQVDADLRELNSEERKKWFLTCHEKSEKLDESTPVPQGSLFRGISKKDMEDFVKQIKKGR